MSQETDVLSSLKAGRNEIFYAVAFVSCDFEAIW